MGRIEVNGEVRLYSRAMFATSSLRIQLTLCRALPRLASERV